MAYDDYIKTYNISTTSQLFDIIQGKDNYPDIRENYIFRGLKKSSYNLIPSSLRLNDKSKNLIDEFIDNSFNFSFAPDVGHAYELGLIDFPFPCKNCIFQAGYAYKSGLIDEKTYSDYMGHGIMYITNFRGLNSNDRNSKYPSLKEIHNIWEFNFEKEIHVLLKFLSIADKSGLKVPDNIRLRKQIHRNSDNSIKNTIYGDLWPQQEYFEIISLAQHYGLPTRALDWTYDYKVALYFAAIGLLDDKNKEDCILWALNYKIFEDFKLGMFEDEIFPLHFYRPEYNINPNLNAQRGLFTIWEEVYGQKVNEISIDKKIVDFLDNGKVFIPLIDFTSNFKDFIKKRNEKIFYKFIISKEIKSEILQELYKEGYSEENLFPGYSGAVLSIKNKAKLDKKIK
ncbi:hypothetical protein MBBAR_10c00040 [Methanobrevibacter arboriphilus JCM 13429 = DSM 1125]|uniref:FRG domain-containing protein n=1 Tax=Methanobrevibacter arboriphilus JCM 13429 = DSM 1125 TaxID=1300164 RepID=A0A1V6N273_METAZ|nr:FRG domain-containing protein [Methanobrevibacter arboriphilus]OQD58663.1 hypothetical protein MBBAR_10c00040 [Methanobrevibacter arboriphilus JCM 13429 = DSM 1125]